MCLAKITGRNSQLQDKSSALIKEGLKCLEESANTLKKEDGTIVNSMAHFYYSQILSELENLSAPSKCTWRKCNQLDNVVNIRADRTD